MAHRGWQELDEQDCRQLQQVLDLIAEKQGQRTVVLDLEEFAAPSSYFVITEGSSGKQIEAIAENIMEKFPGPAPLSEGLDSQRWVVLDYGNLMVHIFQSEVRRFYDLEGIWGEVELQLEGNGEAT